MEKITCKSCGKEIESLNTLVTCTTGIFKVGAFHDTCYDKREKKNNLVIYKPGSARTLHLAAMLFTIFVTTIMIVFRAFSFITIFSFAGIVILDIYVYLSFNKIERYIKKQ